jgi:hypothetical protein
LSPAAEIGPGERTGKYRTSGDQLLIDSEGKSFISFEDYAIAVLDELEHPRHLRRKSRSLGGGPLLYAGFRSLTGTMTDASGLPSSSSRIGTTLVSVESIPRRAFVSLGV